MKAFHPRSRRRARLLQASAVLGACIVAGCTAVAALAVDTSAVETAAGVIDLAPIDAVPDAAVAAGAEVPSGGSSLLPESDAATASDSAAAASTPNPFIAAGSDEAELDGPLTKLRSLRPGLDLERKALQSTLLRLEAARSRAEDRLNAAGDAFARQLVTRFEDGAEAELQALLGVRDATDPVVRDELIAAMTLQDRRIVNELDAATDATTVTASEAERARAELRTLNTRIVAIDAAIEARRPMTKDERQRDRSSRYSIDADYVFATGAIPGIGYWGASTGGGMLSGWMGYAGAAMGGVGCTAPEPGLAANGTIEQGEASWYGPGFHGNNTANGEVYDQMAMTAAHKTLPFGTIVRVFSSATGRCAFVRINDRGPFIDGRIIDLSQAAARQIGMSGTAPVQLEVWSASGA